MGLEELPVDGLQVDVVFRKAVVEPAKFETVHQDTVTLFTVFVKSWLFRPRADYLTSRRPTAPTTFLMRSEMYTETKTLKMSSRSRVNVEVLISHWPSIFS
jgi:hypothetical protein